MVIIVAFVRIVCLLQNATAWLLFGYLIENNDDFKYN